MKKTLIYIVALLFSFLILNPISAQIDIGGKIRDKTLQRVDESVDEGIDAGLDAIEEDIRDGDEKNETQESDEKDESESSEDTNETKTTSKPESSNTSETQQPATLTTYSKYDFVPGEKIVFFDDFTQDAIGDFPALWNSDASAEIVTTNNLAGRWLKLAPDASLIPGTKNYFPDNYTLEFDLISSNNIDFGCYIYEAENPDDFNEGGAVPGISGIKIWFGHYSHNYTTYIESSYVLDGNSEKSLLVSSQKERISIWVQKQRIRVYVNETKIFDVVKAFRPDAKSNVIRFISSNESEPLIGNVRIAAGLPDMRSKLITEGKLVTYGIYFDINSDKIKPESFGTLKGIAAVLTENPDVKVKIYGHTDSDGDDAKNLDLSKRRASSVKAELSKSFSIDGSRIETDGKGESMPIAPNDTPSNKSQNRRVEFIKL